MEILSSTVEAFYNDIEESERLKRKKVNRIEFLTTVRYLNAALMESSKILDACAGGGIYAHYLAACGHGVHACDLVAKNVEKINRGGGSIEKIFVGNILDLSVYEDETFDAVLNLGSYYHLKEEKVRYRAIEESLRVLKKGGIYALSYVNRYANIIKYSEMFANSPALLEAYRTTGWHDKNTVFYAATPEGVEAEMALHSVQLLHHVATDGMKFAVADTVNNLSEEAFEKWLEFHYSSCEDRTVLGASEHGLIIARKL